MTLATTLRIYEPLNPDDVFTVAVGLVMGPEGETTPYYFNKRRGAINGRPNQGARAWINLHHAVDGPLHEEDCEPGCASAPYLLSVNFDTTYGYKADNGAGCADFHAWLVRELGAWLDDRGVKWDWQNEFTGEWHTGYDALPAFGNADLGALA